MINIVSKAIFALKDIGEEYVFINCSFGYDGNINLLFLRSPSEDAVENRKKGECYFKLFSEYPQEYLFIKLSEHIEKITFLQKRMNYTDALQLDENKYLFACARCVDSEGNIDDAANCEILDRNDEVLISFYIGDGITDIQTNSKHEIVIAHYDRDVYGEIDSSGLTQHSEDGHRKNIYLGCEVVDCDGLNVESDNTVWAYVYKVPDRDIWNNKWNSLIKLTNRKVEKMWDNEYLCPYIAVSGNYVFLSGKEYKEIGNRWDEHGGKIYHLENELEFVEEYEFYNSNNTALQIYGAQRDLIVCWADNCLYKIRMDELLEKK
jgi:hypothetical protein